MTGRFRPRRAVNPLEAQLPGYDPFPAEKFGRPQFAGATAVR